MTENIKLISHIVPYHEQTLITQRIYRCTLCLQDEKYRAIDNTPKNAHLCKEHWGKVDEYSKKRFIKVELLERKLFYSESDGAITSNFEIDNITQKLDDDSVKFYKSSFFICESASIEFAKYVARNIGVPLEFMK